MSDVDTGWVLSHLEGGDIATITGRKSKTVIVAFSSFQPDWSELKGPHNFDFMNTIVATDCNGVLVRDTRNLWYLDGTVGLEGVDTLRSRLIEVTSGYERIVVMGSSMGGFASILYGSLIFADQILALVPQARVGSLAKEELDDLRWGDFYANVDQLASSRELRALDRIVMPRHTRIHAVYGDQDLQDNKHRDVLAGTKARIITVRGADHNGAATAALKSNLIEMAL